MTNLRKKIKECGMSARTVAKLLGRKETNVSHQASVGVQTLRVAKRYAAVLDCDPLELLG